MAYNANPNNDVQSDTNPDGTKKVKDASAPQFTGGVGVSDPGNTGAPTSSGAAQSSSAPTGQPASSGQFVNIQKYMNANQGSGQQIGQNITNTIDNKTQQFGNNVSSDAQGVQNQVDSEKQRLASASGFQQQVNDDPTKIMSDPNQLASFKQIYSGTTALPQLQTTANQNAANEQSSLNNLQGTTNLANSEAGRFQLLRQSLGRPSYTQGQQNLDQLLLQSQGNGQILNNLQNSANQDITKANNQYNTAQTNVNQGLGEVGTLGKAAQTNLQGAVTNADTTLQTGLNKQVTDARTTQSDLQSRMLDQEKSGVFDPEVAKLLGITNGENLYDTDLTTSNNAFNPDLININNTASAQDYARANALAQLAGKQNSDYLTGTNPGTPVSPGVTSAFAQNIADANRRYTDLTTTQFAPIQNDMRQIDSTLYGPNSSQINVNNVPAYIQQLNNFAAAHRNVNEAGEDYGVGSAFQSGTGTMGQDYQAINKWQKLYQAMNPNRIARINGAPIVESANKGTNDVSAF